MAAREIANAGRSTVAPDRRAPRASRVRRAGSALVFAALLASCDSGSSSHRGGAEHDVAVARGRVFGGVPVRGATVSFIPASDVDEEDSIQPLESLAPVAEFQALTDRSGEFVIELDAGRYFVFVAPAVDDTVHLPGGSLVRESVVLTAGSTSILAVTLSEQPPADATYVGSSTCLACHTSHASAKETLHFLGFRALTAAGPQTSSLQSLARFPGAYGSLAYFADGNASDTTGLGDGYGHRIATSAGYNILLGRDENGYFQATESLDGTMVSEPLYIPFTYGGEGRFKHRFVTRLDRNGAWTADASAGSYHVLPAQFSETVGDPQRGREVTVPVWVTYHPERWAAPSVERGAVGRTPSITQSFDNSCAGCHFTGMSLTRDAGGLFHAHAVPDPGGPFDFDGDGLAEEMNVGCERCHGPGSEHVAMARGSIVQPDYLPPGRANLICGQCHTRGSGNGTIDGAGEGGFPSRNHPETGVIEFVRAGISPAEFFGVAGGAGVLANFGTTGGFFDPIDLATSTSSSWRDATNGHESEFDHSKQHRQQYLDHARARHGKNPFRILTCQDCHDAHAREREAQVSQSVDDNVLCLRCHAGRGDWSAITQEMVDTIEDGGRAPSAVLAALDAHHRERVFDFIGVAMNLGPGAYSNPAGPQQLGRCTTCHMPKTAKTATWITDDEGFTIRGDVSSHTFEVISPRTSASMVGAAETPVPNSCAECHRGLLRGAYPDYRY